MLHGGCFCGALRYETTGAAAHRTNCHCTMCRGTSGAPFLAWFTVARAGFRFVQGEATRFHSSPMATRTFCPRCGTQLTFEEAGRPDELDVTTCSLDDPEQLPPQQHIYTRSQLGWVKLADGLPTYRGARADG
ncbi:GFA family protein [Janthinobacterium fluminis]|uniref:GFA family protein n=1 Tax=Janthinobacterium fluminis TaxID=2987524 RepID=A0ABT5JWC9_9BURK|nr:GFA family protein [Janthinobacterium fluminis]MDC8756371.1 GFA family protein [Janthinobacterium fluminis]